MYRQSEKKLVKQQYLLHMSSYMVNFGPLTAEIGLTVWGTPANFNWFRVLAALLHGIWASAKLCGVKQRAPSMFGMATITLGIGPHSSLFINSQYLIQNKRNISPQLSKLISNLLISS